MNRLVGIGMALGCLFLSACSLKPWSSPVSSLSRYEAGTYVVKAGDTVDSIASGNSLSGRDLIVWNHLKAPYQLYIGETLTLTAPRMKLALESQPKPQPQKTEKAPAPKIAKVEKPIAKAKPAKPKPVKPKLTKPKAPKVTPQPKKVTPTVKAVPKVMAVSAKGWQWPVSGTLLKKPATGVGLFIGAPVGQKVMAAKAGKVIYAGPDISGVGKMVILDNGNDTLSAYGYLKSTSVSDNQLLKRGGLLGRVGIYKSKPQLHFEVRYQGQIQNALEYLPK